MGEQNKILSRPIFCREPGWDPLPNKTQPSRILAQDFGFPPFLEPNDLDWLMWARKRLASMSWPEFAQTPLLPPLVGRQPATLGEKDPRHLTNGVSEILLGHDSWKITLDVKHFSPEDITITTKEGYLLISGKHEEKQDQQGTVSRCFNRKYKLPPGVDLQHISSSLSSDGRLSVEAPVQGTSTVDLSRELVIPVQTRQRQ